MKALVWTVALTLVASAWAFGDQVVINFTEVGSKVNSIFMMEPNSNNGGEDRVGKLGLQAHGNPYAPCYYFDLPAALVGATIDCATFSATDDWWGGMLDNVALQRIDCLVTWEEGNGTWAARWDWSSGAGKRFVDYPNQTNWQGGTGYDANAEFSSVVADVIGLQDNVGNGHTSTWNITSLVANWADGTWTNDGFVLWTDHADNIGTNLDMVINLRDPTLTIDYTPIPEPASMLFIISTAAAGLLGLARRRRMK